MREPQQVVDAVARRLAGGWHLDLDAATGTWPHDFLVGSVTQSQLEADFAGYQRQAMAWRDWASAHELDLRTALRRVHGSIQSIPTHLRIPDLDTAARLLGDDWPGRIGRARERLAELRRSFPAVADPAGVVRATDGYSDTDFALLCASALWFSHNSAAGLTPRQVPIEGLHAKWLNSHRALVQQLAGLDSLELLGAHPQRIHFSYLDPEHLAGGGRRHDSATVGDTMVPAYLPEVVVISENKDSAMHFPSLPGAISIEGAGWGGAHAAAFEWVTGAVHLVYWGDMDAAGLEIVHQFRTRGLAVQTILMDTQSFESYERFGAATDARGAPLAVPQRRSVPTLTRSELELYLRLTDPEWTRVRRIEQERIPLRVAADAVRRIAGAGSA